MELAVRTNGFGSGRLIAEILFTSIADDAMHLSCWAHAIGFAIVPFGD